MRKLLWWSIALVALLGTILHVHSQPRAQTPTAQQPPGPASPKLEFDVASVKQNKSNQDAHSNFPLDSGNIYSTLKDADVSSPRGSYFSATNQPLWRYIVFAYKLSGTQELALRFSYFAGLSSKAPSWVTGGFDNAAQRFDIEARADGNPAKDQMRLMMQSLLADRFKLVVHHETRQAPLFALVLVKPGKLGPHLQAHPADDPCSTQPGTDPAPRPTADAPSHPTAVGELPLVCGVIAHVPSTTPSTTPSATSGQWHYGGRNVPLDLLATSLPTMTGLAVLPRPVIDQTGLRGNFDFTLEGWTSQAALEADEPGLTFTQVLKDQLGLKLVPANGSVDILVIDHIEHPTQN